MSTSIVPWESEVAAVFGDKAKSLTIYQSDQQPLTGKCIALYGRPGVGKTDVIGQAADSPHASPMLYINIEGGAWVLSHRSDITIVDVTNFQQFATIAQSLFRARSLPWRAIAIDNMSELQALSILGIIGAGGGIHGTAMPTQQQWGKSTADMLMVTRGFHDLARRTGVHVIMTAWEDFGKDAGEVVYRRGIGFTPSLAKSFPGIVDIVGHITVKNDAPHHTRVINFASNPLSDAKFRRSRSDSAMKIPLTIAYRAQPVLADTLNTIVGATEWPESYNKLKAQATVTQVPVTETAQTSVVEDIVASKIDRNDEASQQQQQ